MTTSRRRLFAGVSIASAVAITASLIGVAAANAAPGDPGSSTWVDAMVPTQLTAWTFDPADDPAAAASEHEATRTQQSVGSSIALCWGDPSNPRVMTGQENFPDDEG